MNQTIDVLMKRKSVRQFENKDIPADVKEAILAAAMRAPTAGNSMLYSILDVTDQKLKDLLSESCDHQPFIAKAPLVLVFCADCKKWYDAYREIGCDARAPGAGDLMLAVTDAAIAAQNAVTAAESLGIGSCYIGDIMEQCQRQREILNLPDYVFPAVMLVLGWPTPQQKEREKPGRCPLEGIVHQDAYRPMDGPALRQLLDWKKGSKSYEDWLTAFWLRKYESDFSREMTRSVGEYLEQFKT